MAVRGYEFYYETPTPTPTTEEPNLITNVPTTFVLGGVTEDVARAIRRGIRQNAASVINVSLTRLVDSREVVGADPAP